MAEINLGRVVGSDAEVTAENIEGALGYMPVDEDIVGMLASLTTDEKANLVAAINEVKLQSNENATNLNAHELRKTSDSGGVHGLKVESGTFTPSFRGSLGTGGTTYSVQSGSYYRIGNLVKCDVFLRVATAGIMEGNLVIQGLPFTSSDKSNKYQSASIGQADAFTIDERYRVIAIQVAPNSNEARLVFTGSNIAPTGVTADKVVSGFTAMFSITYEI